MLFCEGAKKMKFFDNPKIWYQPQDIPAHSYHCGFCGNQVASQKGIKNYNQSTGGNDAFIYICPACNGPTFITPLQEQFPAPIFGKPVKNVPEDLTSLYEEARRCTGHNCFTASVLTCRKILMNIAVSQGAKEGLRFIEYVTYLSDAGYIPPNGKHWVDHIRKKGNEATHEIELMQAKDAKELLVFVEMLLKFVYEFPQMIPAQA